MDRQTWSCIMARIDGWKGASTTMIFHLRQARQQDIPALENLIDRSVRVLGGANYSQAQVESALKYVFGVDSQLIQDGAYYVAEVENRLVGAGGWSKRKTLYGGDQAKN